MFFPSDRALQPEGLPHSRGVAASGFRPLRNIPHCCLPQESGPCLSSSVADHPLRPAKHHSHGRPLPHHQTNATQAHLPANAEASFLVTNLCGISPSFPELSPTKRQVTYVLLTRAPLYSLRRAFSFDLHVLGTPPAFVLSQDQTLQANCITQKFNSLTQLQILNIPKRVQNFFRTCELTRQSTIILLIAGLNDRMVYLQQIISTTGNEDRMIQ